VTFLLIPVAFLTSCLAGAIGMGGGVLLIALMPGLVPAAAILPIHALVQLASNVSRAAFGWRHIDWTLVPAITVGAVAGAVVGGGVYANLELHWLPAIIGGLIILLTWVPLPQPRGGGQLSLLLLGFYQSGLGMLAGATGPLGAAVLARRSIQRDWLVVNTASYMSVNHLIKAGAFALIGFSFGPWLWLIAAMVVASVLGSLVGTWLRRFIPQVDFQRWFRLLVTLLALRMIAIPFLSG
jgi:uncharacterized membrane protein YfcA